MTPSYPSRNEAVTISSPSTTGTKSTAAHGGYSSPQDQHGIFRSSHPRTQSHVVLEDPNAEYQLQTIRRRGTTGMLRHLKQLEPRFMPDLGALDLVEDNALALALKTSPTVNAIIQTTEPIAPSSPEMSEPHTPGSPQSSRPPTSVLSSEAVSVTTTVIPHHTF
jgi:hypothetical protein